MSWIDRYPNAPYAYEYELAQGFTPPQAAGIVGNLEQESGVNPEAPGDTRNPRTSGGIAQWLGGRFNPSLITGNPTVDLPRQLAYIMQELNSDPGFGLADLRKAQTPQQAAQIFGTEYERYGIAGARVQDAVNTYNALAIGGAGSGAGAAGLPVSSVPTAQLTSGGGSNPLGWAEGIAGTIVPGLGLLQPVTDTASGLAALAGDIGKFLGVILYGGTWIRFGEALLGTIALSGGMALLVMTLASSPGTLTALGSVAALFPGEGTAASFAAKTAAGARAAGGKETSLSRFAAGAKAEAGRQSTARDTRARAERAEADQRETRRSREHVARHREYQRSQAAYQRSLNVYEKAKERDARANEDEELFAASRGQARQNRTGYRRHMKGGPFSDTRDLRRGTP